MLNQENNVKQFQRKILMSQLNVCAEELAADEDEIAYAQTCINTFTDALSDYDSWYVSTLNKAELKDLVSLIQNPAVLHFLLNHHLKLNWVFGQKMKLVKEDPAIAERIMQYNAPWGKEITQQLAERLSNQNLKRFIDSGVVRFEDLRAWDKSNGLGIQFGQKVLDFLSKYHDEIQYLLDEKYLSIISLHQYLINHHEKGFDGLLNLNAKNDCPNIARGSF